MPTNLPNLITLLGDTRLGASTILSTLGSGSAQGGGIRLEGSVSGALTGIDLGLRTGGGAIRLESIASVRDLTINTTGAASITEDGMASSPAMKKAYEIIERVAGVDSNVLITGESGTGKELLARFIHRRSPRAHRPFIAVNCAALPDGT